MPKPTEAAKSNKQNSGKSLFCILTTDILKDWQDEDNSIYRCDKCFYCTSFLFRSAW